MNQQDIAQEICAFIAHTPLNTSVNGTYLYFDEPLVGYADCHDEVFAEFRETISPEYLLPTDWLKLAGDLRESPSGTVISWVLPISQYVRETNQREKEFPSEAWAHTRFYGENCNKALRTHIVDFFQKAGILAIAPSDHEKWQQLRTEKRGVASNWSERHAAYAAGLGTFGLSDGLITERGVAHRVGSVIAALELPSTPRNYTGIYDNCLYHKTGKCGACAVRCPAKAISKEKGHDKDACFNYTRNIIIPTVNEGYGVTTPSCGMCQTKVPCEAKIPGKQ